MNAIIQLKNAKSIEFGIPIVIKKCNYSTLEKVAE